MGNRQINGYEKLNLQIFNALNEEQQAKVLACDTVEEVHEYADSLGIRLSDEALEEVSGGAELLLDSDYKGFFVQAGSAGLVIALPHILINEGVEEDARRK